MKKSRLEHAREEKTMTEQALSTNMPHLPLVAMTAQELVQAQGTLLDWFNQKIGEMSDEIELATRNRAEAKDKKWRISGYTRTLEVLEQRLRFYGKAKMAVEHGYLLIPDFPCNVFAVRTKVGHPPRESGTKWRGTVNDVEAEDLGVGVGRYVSNRPRVKASQELEDRKNAAGQISQQLVTYFHAASFREVQFPIQLAVPKIHAALHKAMDLKIFDEIAMVGPPEHRDPIAIGRLIDPRRLMQGYNHVAACDRINFFISWHLEFSML